MKDKFSLSIVIDTHKGWTAYMSTLYRECALELLKSYNLWIFVYLYINDEIITGCC